MELKDLVGEHVLTGVDFEERSVRMYGDVYEDSNVCRFELDGVVYAAVEDPCDGYRSHMDELVIDSSPMTNKFFPNKVTCVHVSDGGSDYADASDLLEIIDVKTGKVVLSVGTDNTDDYYPCFQAFYYPENLHINQAYESISEALEAGEHLKKELLEAISEKG